MTYLDDKQVPVVAFILLAVLIAGVVGYVRNFIHFVNCDFDTPVKCEIIGGAGVLIPVVGAIAGYVDIGK